MNLPPIILSLTTFALALLLSAAASWAGEPPSERPPFQVDDLPSAVAELPKFRVWPIETRLVDPGGFRKLIGEHLAYQFALERDGVMFAAGPLMQADETQPRGNGLIAIRADSLESARRIADADPLHAAGVRTYTIRQWIINEGAIDVTIRLSGQNANTIR